MDDDRCACGSTSRILRMYVSRLNGNRYATHSARPIYEVWKVLYAPTVLVRGALLGGIFL